jgi:hypothetical protein
MTAPDVDPSRVTAVPSAVEREMNRVLAETDEQIRRQALTRRELYVAKHLMPTPDGLANLFPGLNRRKH